MKKWRCAVEARPVPSSTNCWQGRILFERHTFSAVLKIFEVPIVVILIRCVSSEAGFHTCFSLKFKPVYRKFASLHGSLWHGTPMSSRPRAIGRSESLLQSHAKTATLAFTRRSASCLLFVSLSNLPRVPPACRNLDRAPIGKHRDVKTYWRKKSRVQYYDATGLRTICLVSSSAYITILPGFAAKFLLVRCVASARDSLAGVRKRRAQGDVVWWRRGKASERSTCMTWKHTNTQQNKKETWNCWQ